MDPQTLMNNSACYAQCIPQGRQWAVLISLADQILSGGGTGGGATAKIASGNGSPVGVVDPTKFILYVQLDSDPAFQQWNSNGVQWVEA
jgi:hypothetical protein